MQNFNKFYAHTQFDSVLLHKIEKIILLFLKCTGTGTYFFFQFVYR